MIKDPAAHPLTRSTGNPRVLVYQASCFLCFDYGPPCEVICLPGCPFALVLLPRLLFVGTVFIPQLLQIQRNSTALKASDRQVHLLVPFWQCCCPHTPLPFFLPPSRRHPPPTFGHHPILFYFLFQFFVLALAPSGPLTRAHTHIHTHTQESGTF